MPEKVKFASIKGMHVFMPGTFNGIPHKESVIDKLVDHFNKLKGRIRPKLKITHDENQRSIASLASYGDVDKLYSVVVDGIKKLYVDLLHVPEQVATWMKDRRFPERSIEYWTKIPVDGKSYDYVFRNVSILGHEPPAVPGLEPIKADNDEEYVTVSMTLDETDQDFEIVTEKAHEEAKPEGGEKLMPDEKEKFEEKIEKMQNSITKLEADLKAKDEEIAKMSGDSDVERLTAEKVAMQEQLTAASAQVKEFETLKTAADEGAKAKKDLQEMKDKTRKDLISNSLEIWKKGGHLLPKDEPIVRALMESFSDEVIKLSVEDADGKKTDEELSQMDLLGKVIESYKHSSFKETSRSTSSSDDADTTETKKKFEGEDIKHEVDNLDLDAKIVKYMEVHEGISYEDAMLEVAPDKE